MRSLIQKSHISELIEQRNGYLVLACGLMLLCLLLSGFCLYLSRHEQIVLTPPAIERSFWVSADAVSPEYLAEMSTFFAYLRLNVTPDTVDHQQQILLRYVDPREYGILKNELIAEQDRIKTQHLSSAFYPVNVQVDIQHLSVLTTGDLISTIGASSLPSERVSYAFYYRYNNGRLWVTQFQEVKTHEK